MEIVSLLYLVVIRPLELIFETFFVIINSYLENAGLAIALLSVFVNFAVLPLYKRADVIQEQENQKRIKMEPWIKHIKNSFKGDERFMMLRTYYRQNDYGPMHVIKGSVSLLLQFPFFIAAYHFLSGLSMLKGASFGPINDLGVQDSLIAFGDIRINILPIIMTFINIISTVVYSRTHTGNNNIQLYILALLFLVLLYNSPSGLVFYWIINNVFSLVKNMLFSNIKSDIKKESDSDSENDNKIGRDGAFFLGAVCVALFTGFLIPSSVISASAEEFVDIFNYKTPVVFILYSLLVSIGFFVVWLGIFYSVSKNKIKQYFSIIIWILFVGCIFNYYDYGMNLGLISSALQYEKAFDISIYEHIFNIVLLLALGIVIWYVFKKKKRIVMLFGFSAMAAMLGLGFYNVNIIQNAYDNLLYVNDYLDDYATIPLSKTGKNVVVIMLDRALGCMVPYILNEKPELKDIYDGFTYYHNTLSYGPGTLVGAPGLYGGYEYIPEEINKRDSELMVKKHNEALSVMPVLFNNNGYDVTVCDPPYAGYREIPDLSIYDDYPEIHKYYTNGMFNPYRTELSSRKYEILKRNLFCYSIMRTAPTILWKLLYNDGLYNEAYANISESSETNIHNVFTQITDGYSTASGYDGDFLDAYSVLDSLPEITDIKEDNINTFLMLTNNTTHEPALLQEPEYVPELFVNNADYDRSNVDRFTNGDVTINVTNEEQIKHYETNMAALIKLGQWFEYLKEHDLYDNTRIIIVSDHGSGSTKLLNARVDGYLIEGFWPLLMVKDFGEKGFNISEKFMTNADVPYLATKDIIEEPVNPFTNKLIEEYIKNDDEQTVLTTTYWNAKDNTGNQFREGFWFKVKENVYNLDDWRFVGEK